MRHLAFLLLAALSPAMVARGQLPAGIQVPGMPDMSKARGRRPAAWKKMASGGVPDGGRTKKLADWLQANQKMPSLKARRRRGDSMKQRSTTASGFMTAGADKPQCPAKAILPPMLGTAPTDAAAAALGRLVASDVRGAGRTAKTVEMLQSALAAVHDAGGLNRTSAARCT